MIKVLWYRNMWFLLYSSIFICIDELFEFGNKMFLYEFNNKNVIYYNVVFRYIVLKSIMNFRNVNDIIIVIDIYN